VDPVVSTGFEIDNWGLHGIEDVDCVPPGCDAVWSGGSKRTLRRDFLLLFTNC